MFMNRTKQRVTVYVEKKTWEAFKKHARASGMSASQVIELQMRVIMDVDRKPISELLKDAFKEGMQIVMKNKEK